MNLTVAELARAVGKNENYVRQHIHRGHLAVRRVERQHFCDGGSGCPLGAYTGTRVHSSRDPSSRR